MPKRDTVLTALGQNVRRRREARELTQEKLAEKAGLDPTYISGIERGLRNPGMKNVARLAKALGFTPEIFKGERTGGGQAPHASAGMPSSLR